MKRAGPRTRRDDDAPERRLATTVGAVRRVAAGLSTLDLVVLNGVAQFEYDPTIWLEDVYPTVAPLFPAGPGARMDDLTSRVLARVTKERLGL